MNTNEISILPNEVAETYFTRADAVTANVVERLGEVRADSTRILLEVVETVNNNVEYEVSLAITKDGYQIIFPQTVETGEVLQDLNRGFDVVEEMLWEDLESNE